MGGWGWGACVKGPGKVDWLLRAAEDAHGGELGMTQLARVLAGELGLTLGPALAAPGIESAPPRCRFDVRYTWPCRAPSGFLGRQVRTGISSGTYNAPA